MVYNNISYFFRTWINFLYFQLRELDIWIPKEVIQAHLPDNFSKLFPATRLLADATEIPIQKPGNVKDQGATFSTYKNKNTIKCMVGTSPSGVVTYLSPGYGGSASDRQIIERSQLLNGMLQRGDSLMADR